MRTQTTIILLIATALLLASVSAIAQGHGRGQGAMPQDRWQVERGQKDCDRDRMRDRGRITSPAPDRNRDQDRMHARDEAKFGEARIYGGEMMSVEERNQYREQLRLTTSDPEARTKFMAQHQEKMQVRTNQQGVKIKDKAETVEAE